MSEGFANSILGGAETLIRSAIKSVNYVLGVAGWKISKTGSAEFNDAIIRGSISAGNGTVLLNSGGVAVISATRDYEINFNAGFLARHVPDDGYWGQLSGNGFAFRAIDPSPLGLNTDFGQLFASVGNPGAANEYLLVSFQGWEYTGKASPSIGLYSQNANDAGADNTSHIEFLYGNNAGFSNNVNVVGRIDGTGIIRGTRAVERPNVLASLTQNIPNSAVTQLNTLVAVKDTYGILNSSAFVLPYAGTWEIGITGRWASNATGQRQVRMQINGVDYYYMPEAVAVSGTNQGQLMVIRDVFAAADQINFQAFQNSGGNLVFGNGARAWAELIEE